MHEWALAEAVVTTSERLARERGLEQVDLIRIELGALQQIEPPIFEEALRRLLESGPELMRGAQPKWEIVPIELHCRQCDHRWQPDLAESDLDEAAREAIHFVPEMAHIYLSCPACGSPDFEVSRGRGVWLATIEGRG